MLIHALRGSRSPARHDTGLHVGAILALVMCILPACRQARHEPGPALLAPQLREPSGIAYHQARHTLFVVGDEGDIYEIHTNGAVVNHAVLPGQPDLEGVTVSTVNGLLYLVVERKDAILEVDPATLAVLRTILIPREFEGALILAPTGDGLEGIAFLPARDAQEQDTFVVANQGLHPHPQDQPALIELRLPRTEDASSPQTAAIVRYRAVPAVDVSALCFDAASQTLYVVSDRDNLLLACTRDGSVQARRLLPGVDQEGFAIDAEGDVYLAQDSGGIVKLPGFLARSL